jgi:hypothetical protein
MAETYLSHDLSSSLGVRGDLDVGGGGVHYLSWSSGLQGTICDIYQSRSLR